MIKDEPFSLGEALSALLSGEMPKPVASPNMTAILPAVVGGHRVPGEVREEVRRRMADVFGPTTRVLFGDEIKPMRPDWVDPGDDNADPSCKGCGKDAEDHGAYGWACNHNSDCPTLGVIALAPWRFLKPR